MHYQIFIPGVRCADPQHLVDVGLGDLVGEATFLESEGPEQTTGVIVGWPKPGQAQMGYQPQSQIWRPAVARGDLPAGRYYVGLWAGALPTPQDLRRRYPQPGVHVTLGDGQQWLLPRAKQLNAEMILADDGTWKFEPQRQYHAFWLAYCEWEDFFIQAPTGSTFSFTEAADFVLSALRINYRVVPELVNELRLFTKENVRSALYALLGITEGTTA